MEERTIILDATRREFDIILAALRMYAAQLDEMSGGTVFDVEPIATNDGLHDAPTGEVVWEVGDNLVDQVDGGDAV